MHIKENMRQKFLQRDYDIETQDDIITIILFALSAGLI